MKKVGLLVNPIAGMGGKVGLKGTDGQEILKKALSLGALPEAELKASQALEILSTIAAEITLYTAPGKMGEDIAKKHGFKPHVVISADDATTAEDTKMAVQAFVHSGVNLLIFAGGDGTARDVYTVLGADSKIPAIGIPAGVKIHSAVYATSPRNAGLLAKQYLSEGSLPLRQAEVMDIDEDAFRAGSLSAKLYGYLSVPCSAHYMQHLKVGSAETDRALQEAIANQVIETMEPDMLYIVGPGSTTAVILEQLGLNYTLLGVDVVKNRQLLRSDTGEKDLLGLIEGNKAKIIVTIIGGQGYIFGRGNQQISDKVIEKVGKDNILIVATRDKVLSLDQGYLMVDTGNESINELLRGYMKIITGYREELIYRVK